jgi:hypothetical protein
VLTTTDINGGTIDGTAIGGASAAAGAFTTLSATGVTTVQAGTAAAPAITTTGDTNTGIFFPAADTIAFSEGGVESARFDASGNMGLGVTPSAWSSYKAIQFGAQGSIASASTATYFGNNWFTDGTNKYIQSGTAGLAGWEGNVFKWYQAPSGTAGNTISFTQAMTLDASGNLLVGRTNTTVANNTGTIIAPTFTSIAGNSNGTLFLRNCSPTVSADIGGLIRFDAVYRNSDGDTTDIAGIAGLRENATNANYAGYLAFSTTPNGGSRTERARIDSAGNMGLGVTPSAWSGVSGKALDFGAGSVFSTTTGAGQTRVISNAYYNSAWKYKATAGAAMYVCDSGNIQHTWSIAASGSADANISFTQAMTLDASGNLLVGTTVSPTSTGTAGVQIAQSSGIGLMYIGKTFSGSTDAMRFYYNGGGSAVQVGSINYTNTATAFNTSSDYRLKENIQPMTGALAKVQALNPVTYTWKADGSDGEGFIAHELQAIVPNAVTGEKDATEIQQYEISPAVPATFDEEGNELTPAVEAVMGERDVPKYQGIDTSFLVATLTAAIQEQQALITTLTARITALEQA